MIKVVSYVDLLQKWFGEYSWRLSHIGYNSMSNVKGGACATLRWSAGFVKHGTLIGIEAVN